MDKLKYTKDGATKLIKENSDLIPIIEADGWKLEAKKKTKKESE